MKRRDFIQIGVALSGLAGVAASCASKKVIKGKIVGASANIGHLLRDRKFDKPVSIIKKEVAIVGAGVSGLSAAYHLKKAGVNDFVLFDLEEKAGGNSSFEANDVSAYPLGAHYIPLPNNNLTEYLQFLKQSGVVTGEDEKGLPVYNELYLCFDPEERLYINGKWQEGLVPHHGVPANERKQISRFLSLMDEYRTKKGGDGKDAFALPVNASSKDESFVQLDKITMKEWLQQQGFTSTYLHWYVNYCTRDDFGTPSDKVSAWAGIHYFACRKGKAANASYHDVLTWPEGNGWLVKALQAPVSNNILTKNLVTSVEQQNKKVVVTYFDVSSNKLKAIEAVQCIIAVPQFVAARLVKDENRTQKLRQHFHYVPWMVANLTVNALEERSGAPLSWDNVIYGSESLGYVNATHQFTQQQIRKRNLTYYLPLTATTVAEARKEVQQKSYEQWTAQIINDLKRIHPNIEDAVEEINIQLWGHAMAQPVPGMIHGGVRKELSASINNTIHFAHTDLAGVSLFEEGFYQGLGAAQTVIKNLSA